MKAIEIPDEVIVSAYLDLKSPRKVAEKLGIGSTTVERRLSKHGVERIGQRGLPRKLPDSIVAEYECGMSMNDIARKYSACLATVAEALRRAGFTARRRGGIRQSIAAEMQARVVEAYMSLQSQEKVAAKLGISQAKVSRCLRNAGIAVGKAGPNHSGWKGGKIRSGDGYVAEWVGVDDPMRAMANNDGYVMEHRLVMARQLGRPLDRSESVHHINGVKTDNRIENLQLRSGQHGNGVVHRCRDCGSTNIESVKLK